jgi:hypothetical protein
MYWRGGGGNRRQLCNVIVVSLRLDGEGFGSCFRGTCDATGADGSCDACLGLLSPEDNF